MFMAIDLLPEVMTTPPGFSWQEQHQKMFAEMQKALQNTQQKSSKPQTMELSVGNLVDAEVYAEVDR